MTLNQNIFAAKLILRIAPFRGISVRLNAVMEIENLGCITQRVVDLFFCPDIEYAFFRFWMAAVDARGYNWTVGIFGGEEATRSEERRVGKECRSRGSPCH